MSKRELKKHLHQLSKEQIEEEFLRVYEKFPAVKTYFDFVFNPKEEQLLREAKSKIKNEFFPNTGKRPKMRRSIAQKFIKHFIFLGLDPFLVADLMLYTMETAQILTDVKTIKQESFYKGMYNSYNQTIKFINEQKMQSDFELRLGKIAQTAVFQEWPNGEQLIWLWNSLE